MSPPASIFSSLTARSSGDAAVLLDHAGCILRWTAGAEGLYGYSSEDAFGRPLHWLMPELREETAANWLAECRSAGTSSRTLLQRRSNGSVFSARAELLALQPTNDGSAAFTLWVTFAVPSSELPSSTRADRQYRFQARLLDAIGQSVIATDLDGTIFYWNRVAQDLYGWTAQEAVGANVSMLLPDPGDYPQYEQAIRGGDSNEAELWLRHRDGRVFPVQVTGVGLYNEEGHLIGRVGVSIDITERKQAETALRASEAQLRQVLSSAHCILWHAEIRREGDRLRWDVRMWDDGVAQQFLPLQVSEGGQYSHAFYAARPVEDQDRMRAVARKAILSGASGYTREFRCRASDGTVRWLWEDVHVEPAGLDCWRAVGVCTDITDRKAAEEERRRSAELFRVIVENAALGVAVVTPDDRLVLANPAFCAMLGYAEAELQGITSAQFTHPEDLERELPLIRELVEKKQGLYRLEKRFVNRRGEEIWAHLTASVVMDEAGSILFGIGLVEDIRERKRSEQRTELLLSLGQRLNRTSTPEEAAQIVLDAADRLLGWDACWLELVKDQLGDTAPVLMFDEVDGQRTRILDPGTPAPFARRAMVEGPFRILRVLPSDPVVTEPFGNCERLSASILCVPIRVRDGVIGALSIQSYRPAAYQEEDLQTLQALADYCAGALERTRADQARQELESQLVQAVKMEAVGRLAGGIAHDSNNMLAVINGYSELLLGMVDDRSPLRPGLQEIRRAGDRVADMTRQLLAFSRKQLAQPRRVSLNEVVHGAQRMLHPLIGEDITLEVELSPEAGSIRIDPNHLEQLLVNLAVNARDAMPHGGRLSFRTQSAVVDSSRALALGELHPGRYAELIVTDTGCGIEPALLPRIFEPFFTTKGVGQGTGLGLAMVYGIVRQNGGQILVESRPGEGTTFRIYFPEVDVEVTQDLETTPEAPDSGTETVLVVEDNDVLRALIESVLRSSGYQVLTAREAVEALRVARSHSERIDLLLTDVVLPGRNGRELSEEFLTVHPEARVLFMSGYTNDAVILRGIAHGERNFLQKPFTPTTLTARVREILNPPSVAG